MPDASGADDGATATRHEDGPTRVDALEVTEPDPFATAMPATPSMTRVEAGPADSTVEDPYSTRVHEAPTDPYESVATRGWAGPAGPGRAGGGSPSRYQAIRLHARGGLGEVFVAVDGELNREVALKEIQERHLDKLESHSRFVFEAEITGGLEHPGIVPVYGLGRHPDGRPYYAMRFIRGDSLRAALKKFHEARTAGKAGADLGHSLEFRQLVSRFVAVCHAIDYAHARGVIHRDIKPDNIMIGPHGETLVVDWGLAKAVDRPEPEGPSAHKPLRPLSGGDTSATMDGSVLGTPAYMSPEQAAGEIETLGPASDIFSLGSTLYALMTGHSPFREKGLTELIDHVRKAEFPPPRSLDRAIPRPLEAIGLKAMALYPGNRYPTAAALADDLERWLADERVLAYAEPWPARLARRARRHRTAVAVAFALLMATSTALAIGNVLVNRERARAEQNHQRARSAVEQMLTRVGEVDLADVPQMESVRRDLLDRALAFYRESLAERRGDPASLLETGRALARLGDIREMLGQYVQAEEDYREALALLEPRSADIAALRALARARNNLGILLKKSNRFAEAEALLREALRDRQGLASAHPGDLDDARAASATLYQLGTLLARLGRRTGEDEDAYRRAIRDQRALADKPSDRPEDRKELARYLNNLGILQAGSDPDGAEKTFLEALKVQDELKATSASNAGFRWQAARTWNNLANLYTRARLPQDADPAFAKARAGFESLAADFPSVPDYRRELAVTLNNLAQMLEANPSSDADPVDLLRRAEADQVRLVAQFPEVPDHRMKLAITRLHLGDLLRATDPAASDAALGGAIRLQETLVADHPQVPEYHAALGRTLTEQARSKAIQGDQAGSLELLKPAIAELDRAIQARPGDLSYTRFLFDARGDRCLALLKLGRHADLALEAKGLAAIAPDRPEALIAAAGFLARCFEMAGGDAPRRETYARDAIQALRDALKRGHPDPAILDGPDFKPLKGRPDFERLREDWAAKGRKALG